MAWERATAIGGLLGAIFAAISAYFSYESSKSTAEIARKSAAIQAVSKWSLDLEEYPGAGVCVQALTGSDNYSSIISDIITSPLKGVAFEFKNSRGKYNDIITAVYNCVFSFKEVDGDKQHQRDFRAQERTKMINERTYYIDGDESRGILRSIQAYANIYNTVLAYYNEEIGDKDIICAEVKPAFDRALYDYITMLESIHKDKGNEKAKREFENYKYVYNFKNKLKKDEKCPLPQK